MRNHKTLGCLIGGIVLLSASVASAQRWGRPQVPQGGACFYEDIDFGGQYFCSNIGTATPRIDPGDNDRISSIRIFGNAEVTIYRDIGYEGSSRRITSDARDLRRGGWNDRLSSFRVYRIGENAEFGTTTSRDAIPSTGACFYEGADFGGQFFCIGAGTDTGVIPPSTNDKISSIRVLGNASVTAFQDGEFRGRSARFDVDVRDLGREGWNDMISSFRITSRGGFGGGPFGGGFGRGPSGGFSSGLQVYADINYKGTSGTISSNTPNLSSSGMANMISSIRVPAGETWQVCTEVNYQGRCQLLTSDAPDLRRGNWNDAIVSARRMR